jgi:hypothetical protein
MPVSSAADARAFAPSCVEKPTVLANMIPKRMGAIIVGR